MPAGKPALGLFTPNKPGSYTFYCDVPGHREAGMVGTLIVAPWRQPFSGAPVQRAAIIRVEVHDLKTQGTSIENICDAGGIPCITIRSGALSALPACSWFWASSQISPVS
jgi:hypothetical protein